MLIFLSLSLSEFRTLQSTSAHSLLSKSYQYSCVYLLLLLFSREPENRLKVSIFFDIARAEFCLIFILIAVVLTANTKNTFWMRRDSQHCLPYK